MDPAVGGLLIRGPTGTGKSTIARTAAGLCPWLDPGSAVVTVPLGTTEDNILGSPDIAMLLGGEGFHAREGLLARADGRILLLDDIGLMPDTNLDLILEASADGGLDLERDGVSARIETRFTLLATWNPASGPLRPRVADRFGISVDTDPLSDLSARSSASVRALASSVRGPSAGAGDLREAIRLARRRLGEVRLPGWLVPSAALLSSRLKLDGQRAEISSVRTAIAIAALHGRRSVSGEDFERGAVLAVCHRTRMGGSASAPGRDEVIAAARECRRIFEQGLEESARSLEEFTDSLMHGIREAIGSALREQGSSAAERQADFEPVPYGRFSADLRKRSLRLLSKVISNPGARGRSCSGPASRMVTGKGLRGRRVRLVPALTAEECDVLPTVRAAILARGGLPVVPVSADFWRRWEVSVRPAVTSMLVVDASMSSQAYLQGLGDILTEVFAQFFDPLSKVGLIAITRGGAELVFTPTRNRRRVFGRVKDLVPGGNSPLADGLYLARRELSKSRRTEGARNCFVMLVSDCYPEPVPPGRSDIYESEPYTRVRLEARALGSARMPVAILDPMNVSSEIAESLPGRRLARFVARASSGVLIPVPSEKIRHSGFSVAQLLGVERERGRKLAQQIANQLEVYRKQQTQPGGPIG